MSRIEWQWLDTGSGSGVVRQVIVLEQEAVRREAFRRWLTHGACCRICRVDETRCERGKRLGEEYWAANRSGA